MSLFKKLFKFKKGCDFVNDRRKSKRYGIMLKLNYTYPETKSSGESFTKNISSRGLRFPVDSRIPKGSLLNIKVEDPNGDRLLSLKSRVAWLEEFSGEDVSGAVRYETGVSLLKNRLF